MDYKQCFDAMWLEETINDMFEAGLVDDNLNLIYKMNEKNKVEKVKHDRKRKEYNQGKGENYQEEIQKNPIKRNER